MTTILCISACLTSVFSGGVFLIELYQLTRGEQ